MATHRIYKFSWKNVTSICIKLRRGPIFMIPRARKLIMTWINTRPDQSMAIYHRKSNRSIDNNRWQLVNCYRLLSANRWPIDNHKLESSNCYRLPSITIDYHRLQSIIIDHRLLLTVICCQAVCLRSIFDQLLSSARGRVRVWWLLLRLLLRLLHRLFWLSSKL